MGIEVSTRLIHASIAQVLHEISPDAEIFDNPNQQGTPYPAWFIVHRSPVEVRKEIRRYYITYYIDVWYLIKQNLTQMFDQYTRIAEQLADKMEYIPVYGYKGVVLHTFETSWSIEMTAMKYSITLRLVCSRDNGVPQPKMYVIEDFQTFIKGLGKLKRIRYICSQFPDFDMGLETLQYCTEGNTLVLPFVSGIYRDGHNTRWEPLTWNVGAFGSQYGPVTEDVTIDLEMGVVVGFDVVVGGTIGVGANVGRDIVWRITDMSRDGWHYVGPEHSLATEPVVGGVNLSRDEYEPIGPQKSLGLSPVYGGTVEPYSQGGTDTVTGTISGLALPMTHSGSYTGVSFDSLRYYAKATISNKDDSYRYCYGNANTWFSATLTWHDDTLGDLSDKIATADPSGTERKTQEALYIIFITNGIAGYSPNQYYQISEYTYNNGTHSLTFYTYGTGEWYNQPGAGRIQIRYLDGTTTFDNLSAFDLVNVSNGSLSKDTTTDRYAMYNAWNGEITLKADYK